MKYKGFTLVEMVMTIVIIGIVALGMSGFIELGTKGYVDSVDRQRLQNQARFVIEKLTREFRHAVPNSFALSDNNHCISFYPIKYSGYYYQDEANDNIQFILDNQATSVSFANDEQITINPSRQADLTTAGTSSALGLVSESDGVYTLTDSFSGHSISGRHYIYTDKVTYCITNTDVITRKQGDDAAVYIGENLDRSNSSFSYEEASLQRGGVVHLDLLFINDDEQSSYKHNVQVLNVP
ncbi:prepilin-type cleavage/methylation domain-containing protein [Vibrio albus]|uniref:Prepilin-type cleavage/methylation domain-containing protein n=1 Tax=Vibrio albus TaxID=2200953 RepID=A0A2U3B5G2_9VIBR|nr:type II secretion system protein [Vibrio albus]PWI32012.1 prepilin-type cleavage/methylation domain-containing protein [Vibrio albus]